MSKIIYVCLRDPYSYPSLKKDIETISYSLIPDNITPAPTKIVESKGIVYGIVNPVSVVADSGVSVLLGKAFDQGENWGTIGKDAPDGTYALFRGGDDAVELISDAGGTRSIWYYKSDSMFVASTSQRAIVALTREFTFNRKVLPWILSTGALGPSMSWDSRIKLLPADSTATLNRESWTLSLVSKRLEFAPEKRSADQQKELLEKALRETFEALKLDYSKWLLPLSGGYDSRSILAFLSRIDPDIKKLKAITWGLKRSILEKGNDAFVASKVAEYFGIQHKYYSTDLSEEPIELVFNRFLTAGEGRVDQIGGYLDGFKIWKTLFEDNVQGIIRGDVGFSTVPPESEFALRKRLGIGLCSDYLNLKDYESFGFDKQEFPEDLVIKEHETLAMWRDRLYHGYRIPTVLAALSDLKVAYVELVNPLLSRKVLYEIRQLSDNSRNNKRLFKLISDSISPNIPYAKASATAKINSILKSEEIVTLFKSELSMADAKSVFPDSFVSYVLDNVKVGDLDASESFSFKVWIKKHAPRWLKNKVINANIKTTLSFNIVAFRMYIALKMYRTLTNDSVSLRSVETKMEPLQH